MKWEMLLGLTYIDYKMIILDAVEKGITNSSPKTSEFLVDRWHPGAMFLDWIHLM